NMFKAFVIKEFNHILRDGRTLMMLVALPIALILLFGFAISTEIRNVNVGVMIAEDDAFITDMVTKIDQSKYFTVRERFTSEQQIDDAIRQNKVDAVLSFGPEFGRKVQIGDGAEVSLIMDASNPNNASTESMYLSGIIQDYLMEKFVSAGTVSVTPVAAGASAQAVGGAAGLGSASAVSAVQRVGTIIPNVRMLYNPQLRSAYNFVPGILGMILLLICALMTSVSIVKEKEVGTMEVLLVSPVKPIAIVLAKMIPYFVLSCVILLITFLMIFFVLQVPLVGSLFWVIVVSLLYLVLGLGIGLLVSSMVDSQITAVLISAMVFMVPVMMLSGMLFEVDSMPGFFRVVSNVVPARWFIIVIKKIMIEGLAVRYAMKEILILAGMTFLIFFVAVKRFNDRLE
ncbi:MAG: ABC transporter permease, partial [Prevotellaceae bacterium]|nr:ABC transporter permease [Prevotellaceae bacterium]